MADGQRCRPSVSAAPLTDALWGLAASWHSHGGDVLSIPRMLLNAEDRRDRFEFFSKFWKEAFFPLGKEGPFSSLFPPVWLILFHSCCQPFLLRALHHPCSALSLLCSSHCSCSTLKLLLCSCVVFLFLPSPLCSEAQLSFSPAQTLLLGGLHIP